MLGGPYVPAAEGGGADAAWEVKPGDKAAKQRQKRAAAASPERPSKAARTWSYTSPVLRRTPSHLEHQVQQQTNLHRG